MDGLDSVIAVCSHFARRERETKGKMIVFCNIKEPVLYSEDVCDASASLAIRHALFCCVASGLKTWHSRTDKHRKVPTRLRPSPSFNAIA